MNKKPNVALKSAVRFFLLIVLGEGAAAQMGIIGKECLPGNLCLDRANQICDTNSATPQTCKVKQGMGCHRTPDQCVAGAFCLNTVCSCKVGSAVPQDSGLCQPAPKKVGGECNPGDSQPCDDSGARCTGIQAGGARCQCGGDLTVDYQNYSCVIPAKKVGGMCVTSDDPPCDDVNANCTGDPAKCQCRADFIVSPKSLTCELDVGTNCSGRETLCRNGTICDANDHKCKITHGKSCEAHMEFCVTGAICLVKTDSIPICTCLQDIYSANTTTGACYPAARKVGGSCEAADVSPCDDVNAVCTEQLSVCTCKDGATVNETSLTCVVEVTDQSNAADPLLFNCFLLLPPLWELLFSLQ